MSGGGLWLVGLWQPHLLSIAENINEAEFNPKEYERIDAVVSKEGERIQVSVWPLTSELWSYQSRIERGGGQGQSGQAVKLF